MSNTILVSGKHQLDTLDRVAALKIIESKASTSQLKKISDLANKPGALEKFEKNFKTLTSFL